MKNVLEPDEMLRLIHNLREVFAYIEYLKRRDTTAWYIKRPQIPSILTESLAVHLIRKGMLLGELHGFTVQLAHSGDLVAIQGSTCKRIEVKATGDKGFQRFSTKDLGCDYLIWFCFGSYLKQSEETPISVLVIKEPRRFFTSTGLVWLRDVKERVGADLEEKTVRIAELFDCR